VDLSSKFLEINKSKKIWAIGSIHSHLDSFNKLKKHIIKNFSTEDKIVFLGNVIGVGEQSKETLSSIIDLRRKLMSVFYLKPNDVIFLRGAQEEMFLKLLQLHIAPNPKEIVKWMLEHGVDKTVVSYGLDAVELLNISEQGTLSINKWTSNFNKIISNSKGHKEYFSSLHHAAFSHSKKILFVNRGVDTSRPLSAQNDCFWWGYHNFSKLDQSYGTFVKIVRGYEPKLSENFENIKNKIVCSLYKGPLSNKKITAGLFNDSGDILDIFESK
jgi:hypothetical protein